MKQRTLLEIENKICKNSTIRKMQTIFGNGNIFVKSPKTRTFFKFENKFWILEHFLKHSELWTFSKNVKEFRKTSNFFKARIIFGKIKQNQISNSF